MSEYDDLKRLIEVAQQAVYDAGPCEHEIGKCAAHGWHRLPCGIADLQTLIDELCKKYNISKDG